MTSPEPLSGDLFHADDTPVFTAAPARVNYWYVFGAPVADTKGASKNYPQVTYGPNPKAPDDQLRAMTFQGEKGETFRFLGAFTHDPTDDDLRSLRPKAYK